jgi:hypothetical protein
MIIWFITIISILFIYWFQYPYITNNKNKYKNTFNHIKIPLFVICVLILVFILYKCKNNIVLDVNTGLPNF